MPSRHIPPRKVILDAYMAEGEGLQKIHVHVAKELKRLQLEENMLKHLLEQTKKHLPPESELLQDDDEQQVRPNSSPQQQPPNDEQQKETNPAS